MSTGLNCMFQEVKPGEWWYFLEQWSAPKMAFDWMEYADACGPFTTQQAAIKHLHDNNANPGGYEINEYEPGFEPGELMKRLMREYIERKRKQSTYRDYRSPRYW